MMHANVDNVPPKYEDNSARYLLFSLILLAVSISIQIAQANSSTDVIAEVPHKLDLNNSDIFNTSMTIVADYPGEYNINQVCAIYNALSSGGWYYFSDPSYGDFFQNANFTLQMGRIKKTIGRGDCDDFAILMSSLIQSIGGSSRIKFAVDNSQNQKAHAYAEVFLGYSGNPHVKKIIEWLKAEYNVDEIYGIENASDEIWLNLDWGTNPANASYPGGPILENTNPEIVSIVIWQSKEKVSPKIVPIIDTMDDITVWETAGDDKGSTINLTSIPGKKQNGTKVSYDLKESGWIGISKKIDPIILSEASGISISYFLMGNPNPLELRMVYDDGTIFSVCWSKMATNTWSYENAMYKDFVHLYTGIGHELNKTSLDVNKVRKIELVLSNQLGNMAGPGTIVFDNINGIMAIPSGSPWERAEKARQDALSSKLVAQAEMLKQSQKDKLPLSVQLSIEALRLSSSNRFQADQSLRNGLALLPRSIALIPHDDDIKATAFSPDGMFLATASGDCAQVWMAHNGSLHLRLKHNSSLTNLAFSPDGKYLATASIDKYARLWETATGKELLKMVHNAPVMSIVFSPDGNTLATTSYGEVLAFNREKYMAVMERYGGGLSLWNTTNGKKMAELYNDCCILDIAFTPDGRYLVIRDDNRTLRLKDLTNDHENILLSNNADIFAPSRDSKYIAIAETGDFIDRMRICDIRNGREVANISMKLYPIDSLTFSPDNKYLAASSSLIRMPGSEYTPRIWQIATGEIIELLPLYEASRFSQGGPISALAFSPDNKLLATSAEDNTTRIWDIDACKEVARMPNMKKDSKIIFSPDGKYLAIESGKIAGIWGTTGYPATALLNNNNYPKTHVALSPDGRYIATTGGKATKGFTFANINIVFNDCTAQIWEISNQSMVAKISHEAALNAIAFSNDSRYLATASSDNTSAIWEIPNGNKYLSVNHDDSVNSVAFSPDGKVFATASSDRTARLWNTTSGKELVSLTHDSAVNTVSFSPSGIYLATGDELGNIWILDAKNYRKIAHLTCNVSVLDLAFSPDSEKVAAICGSNPASSISDHIAYVWNVNSRQEIRRITHEEGVQDVAFSPDGRYIAIAIGDGTVRIEAESDGQVVSKLSHDECVYALAFSSDGKYLATGSGDRTARVWLWRPDDLIAEACSRLGKSMTREEWGQFLGDEPYCRTCGSFIAK
jgi:WD40 repeat protein